MIVYDTGEWGVSFIFQLKGSVYLKTLLWSVPCTTIAILINVLLRSEIHESSEDNTGIQIGVGAYTTVLSFLLVFRTQQAYARWWEGGTLLQTLRGEWFNAYSNLLSFTNREAAQHDGVEQFQHLLVRLMSLLHGAAMQQVSTGTQTSFEVIDLGGFDLNHLEFLQNSEAKCEVILQWIQRLIVQAMTSDILPIPAPILSRVFQELSRGIVNLANARKISELPFPFPYAQMITVTLIIHWVMMPLLMGIYCSAWWVAGGLTFITVTSLWSINYVAQEIESPFGDDNNDLPLEEMQKDFNRHLVQLIMREAQEAPTFRFKSEEGLTSMVLIDQLINRMTLKSNHSLLSSKNSMSVDAELSDSFSGQHNKRRSADSMLSSHEHQNKVLSRGSGQRESAYTKNSVDRFEKKLRTLAIKENHGDEAIKATFSSENHLYSSETPSIAAQRSAARSSARSSAIEPLSLSPQSEICESRDITLSPRGVEQKPQGATNTNNRFVASNLLSPRNACYQQENSNDQITHVQRSI